MLQGLSRLKSLRLLTCQLKHQTLRCILVAGQTTHAACHPADKDKNDAKDLALRGCMRISDTAMPDACNRIPDEPQRVRRRGG